MLLAVDIGNTHTVLGTFRQEELVARRRIRTVKDRTADEIRAQFSLLLREIGGLEAVTGAVVSSVVPTLDPALDEAFKGMPSLRVDHRSQFRFEVDVDRPEEVGADRLVNAEGALELADAPLVIVDVGTAITVCAVAEGPRYVGGAIAPGPGTAAESLYARASKLAAVPLVVPGKAIGRSTEQALQSGLMNGFGSLVDGLVERFREELGGEVTVLGTGGWLIRLGQAVTTVDRHVEDLTLRGLRSLAERHGLLEKSA